MGRATIPRNNQLLEILAPGDLDLLRPALAQWQGRPGEILQEPGKPVRFAYFPYGTSLVSCQILLSDNRSIETASIGREGVAGGLVSDSSPTAYFRMKVQSPGAFWRIDLETLEEAKAKSLWISHLFARYAEFLLAQSFQSVACNAAHSIEQRIAKWLLSAVERVGDRCIPLTQEQLSASIGVGRTYVSTAIQSLKSRSLLNTARGRLIVNDTRALDELACDCNNVIRRRYEELLRGGARRSRGVSVGRWNLDAG